MVEEAAADPWPICLDRPASDRARPFFEAMVTRRAAGEPLQYVLGHWSFRGLELLVDRRVLIPRPETEQVVEVALGELRALRESAPAPQVVDLGTGSGAIGLAIASEVTDAQVWATDSSADALAVARANLAGIGSLAAARVRMAQGSWFDPLPGELRGWVQLVVTNPPYVALADELPDVVAAWEPPQALYSGPTGLEAITEIVGQSPDWLARPGALVVEVAPHQAGQVLALAQGSFDEVEIRPDLAGRDRALVARLG
jgi:release factor glutamine methyltransferase